MTASVGKRFIIIFMGVLLAVWPAMAVDKAGDKGPKAVVPVTEFQFDPVLDGSEVLHDFVVQNQGDAPLKIEKVRTG